MSRGAVDNLVSAMALHMEACVAANLSAHTLKMYDGRYKQFLAYLASAGHASPFELELLSANNTRRAATWVRSKSLGRRGGESAGLVLTANLKTLSAWCCDEGIIEADGLARVRRPKRSSTSRQPFAQHEVRALRVAAAEQRTGLRDVAMLRLLLDTGMRVGELCTIRLEDLDLRGRRVVVRGKGNRDRALYFGDPEQRHGGGTPRAIQRWIEVRDTWLSRAVKRSRLSGTPQPPTSFLWLGLDGWPLQAKGWAQALERIAVVAEMAPGTVFPHRFRHTFATWYLVRHPGDEFGLRGILGHLSPDTYRVYVHLAHEIIAQRAGRVSLSEAWLGDGDRGGEP